MSFGNTNFASYMKLKNLRLNDQGVVFYQDSKVREIKHRNKDTNNITASMQSLLSLNASLDFNQQTLQHQHPSLPFIDSGSKPIDNNNNSTVLIPDTSDFSMSPTKKGDTIEGGGGYMYNNHKLSNQLGTLISRQREYLSKERERIEIKKNQFQSSFFFQTLASQGGGTTGQASAG